MPELSIPQARVIVDTMIEMYAATFTKIRDEDEALLAFTNALETAPNEDVKFLLAFALRRLFNKRATYHPSMN